MYELDNRKDQVMTVFKVALANLGMWVRDRYFPVQYVHAGWQRLQLFFQLPGRIFWGEIESRLSSSDLMTVPSLAIWRCCVQRSPKNSRIYRMDAVSCFMYKGEVFYF
jgi:hypothetical protein